MAGLSGAPGATAGEAGAGAYLELPPLPFAGVLSKRSELLGIWQPRRVEVDVGSLRYFRDGAVEARATFGPGDLIGVGELPPTTVLFRARLAGGDERTYELRAQDESEMRTWVGLIALAFGLEVGASAFGPVQEQPPARSDSNRSQVAKAAGAAAGAASGAAAAAAGLFGRVTGKADWLDEKIGNARQFTGRLREQLEHQLEEALTSCDDGKTELLLDSALGRGVPWDQLPGVVQRAARRVAGRNLRNATESGDPKQLKGALLAARRLHATGVPEFERAVARYREVQRLPDGWDVARMVEERQRGPRLLAKNDVSANDALRGLIQFMVDRTFLRVETRDRRGEQVPVQLKVVQVAEVQNESQWVDYMIRREIIRQELDASRAAAGSTDSAAIASANAATEGPIVEAAALGAHSELEIKVPPHLKAGDVMRLTSPVSGQPILLPLPHSALPGAPMPLHAAMAAEFPGPEMLTSANEVWLFHGTKPVAAENITSDDFRLDLAGTSAGTLYGRGIYLAENSTKADEYSHVDPKSGLFSMLLCRATLGRFKYTAEVQPDPRQCEDACLRGSYHSVLGDRKACRGTFREFVVFDEDQVYPNYIVRYKRVLPRT